MLAELEGAAAALSVVDTLDLETYVPFHVVRADLLDQLGDSAEAVVAYDRAIELTTNAPERAFLERKRAEGQRRG